MKQITEYLSTKVAKPSIIKATSKTIQKIVKAELDRLGHDCDLNHIDVSEVTSMYNLFSCYEEDLGSKYEDLNPDISKWDVSNVENMNCMFWRCRNFNQDISKWDVSKVGDMSSMFYECENFNQDLSWWDVSNVKYMDYMFNGCKNFNQDLSEWDLSNARLIDCMFACGCPIQEEFKPKLKK